jgi:chromosome segregation ATPase
MYNWFNYSRIKRQLENQLEENARLRGENKTLEDILKAIQEDGTTEHNNAINLRESVAHLREEAEKFYNENVQLTKEVRDLRHLKTENVELIERLRKEGNSYGITFNEAKTQIIQNDYKKCAQQRDEYKHQLNAANKEIEALKSKLRDYQDKYAKSFSYNDVNGLQKEIEALKLMHGEREKKLKTYNKSLQCQITSLKEDNESQKHPMYPLHWGGYDKNIIDLVESELNNQDHVEGEWMSTWCYKCQHIKEQCKCDKYLNIQDLPKTFPNEFQEPTWEEAASDLALKLVKLEKKIQDLTRLPKN